MNASATHDPIPLDRLRSAITSPHVPVLFTGSGTHDAALRFVAQLVRHTPDDARIREIVKSCLPADYAGNTLDELSRMIAEARRKGFDQSEGSPTKRHKDAGPKPSERALELIERAGVKVCHDAQREAFLSVPQTEGGVRNFRIASADAALLIGWHYYRAHKKSLTEASVKEVLALLMARALYEAPCHETHLRIGGDESEVYVDLGQDNARVVRITSEGWSITTDCPIKFCRSSGFRPLPDPKPDGDLELLPRLLGLDDRAWHLLLAFIVNALNPTGPFMCLLLDGEQGSGKSLLCSLLKRIIDPNAVDKLRLPRSEQDLMIQASDNRLLVFDNASGVKAEISDTLCSLATGGGFSTRKLYTDRESCTFTHCRPFIINGIGEFASRPDLLERAISLSLPSMPEETRKLERTIIAAFEEMLPGLLGRLFDLVACALANLGAVTTPQGLRMADAARWIAASEPETGLPSGTLARCLVDAQHELMVNWVMGQPLVLNLLRVVADGPFDGTVGRLLEDVLSHWSPHDRFRPNTPSHFSNQLTRIRPVAVKAGLFIELLPHAREGRPVRVWTEGQDVTERREGDGIMALLRRS